MKARVLKRLKALCPGLLLLASAAGAQAPEKSAGLDGETLYIACAGCHTRAPDAPHGVGPNLHDLDGRPAGSLADFAYSPALAEADLTWNRGTLTAWIVGGETMVPGTWMLYHNALTPEEVQRLVDWLLDAP